jgi:hypothetical protein
MSNVPVGQLQISMAAEASKARKRIAEEIAAPIIRSFLMRKSRDGLLKFKSRVTEMYSNDRLCLTQEQWGASSCEIFSYFAENEGIKVVISKNGSSITVDATTCTLEEMPRITKPKPTLVALNIRPVVRPWPKVAAAKPLDEESPLDTLHGKDDETTQLLEEDD